MKIKRTVAADMRAAMQIIRDTHGPDAVILSKRPVAGGIEVVSAIDVDDEPAAAQASSRPAARPARTPRPARRGTVAELEEEVAAATSEDEQEASRTVVRAQQLLESAKAASRALTGNTREPQAVPEAVSDADSFEARLAAARAAAPEPRAAEVSKTPEATTAENTVAETSTPVAIEPTPEPAPTRSATLSGHRASVDVAAELKRLRQVMDQQLAIMGWQAQVERSPASVALLRDLHALDFDAGLSQRLCAALSLQADPDTNWQLARHWLAARLLPADTNPMADAGVSAVFGASGSGKTSTVVKLAAQYALREGPESVALVSTDTERVGGTATLNAFASVLGVPVHSVTDLAELGPLLGALRAQHARVLIDTGNGDRNRQIALALADVSEQGDFAMQNFIVLAANASAGDSLALLGALGRTLPVAAILGKTDEATSFGGVLSTVIEHQLPIAAMSTGARIPDDITVPDADMLIALCENAPAARNAASSLSEPALAARFGVAL